MGIAEHDGVHVQAVKEDAARTNMKPELPQADALIKIGDAHCLTVAEMQTLSAALAEIHARREIDALDLQWENDMKKYVSLRRSKGGRIHLIVTSRGDVFGGMLVGLGIACFGGYMTWQFVKDPRDAGAALIFFGFLFVVGIWVLLTSWRSLSVVNSYERERRDYLVKRQQLSNLLPEESRLPMRYCTNCLSRFVWHGNQTQGYREPCD